MSVLNFGYSVCKHHITKQEIMKNFILLLGLMLFSSTIVSAKSIKLSSNTGKVLLDATLKSNASTVGRAEVLIYKNNKFETFEKTSFSGKLVYELEDNSNYLFIFRKKGFTDKIVCVNTCSRTGLDASGSYATTFNMMADDKSVIAQLETIDLMSNLNYSLLLPTKDIRTMDAMFEQIASAFKEDTFISQE